MKTKEIELSEEVRKRLEETVKAWADENLEGKPAILANMVFMTLENALIKKTKELVAHF